MKNVIRAIVVLLVVVLLFVQSRPDRFHVERSATIGAPAESVFAHIDNFHRWRAWSPWEKLDPRMQRSFEGPESGVGAVYRWSGNNKAGAGSMKITQSTPGSVLAIDMEFLRPMKDSNVATFTLTPEGAGTKVTWVFEGRMNFLSKAMCVFVNLDKMVGPDFERGLASLKSVAESAPAAAASADTTAPAAPAGMSVK